MDVVPAPEAAHITREKMQAADEGRAMRHPYRSMPLTGAPAARFPEYLWARHLNVYDDLDENGHAPKTLHVGAPEHDAGCDAGWIDQTDCFILDGDKRVIGFRNAQGVMATEEELQSEARRYARNWAADTRFCHVFNHSHECKPTCFKNTEYKKPSADEAPKQRGACRFRFWRLALIAGRWWRRMGKALVPKPTVAAADDVDNEFGRCKVCRENCFRGSSQDLCQACLRCNVDYQYQIRTFPEQELDEGETPEAGASEHIPEATREKKNPQRLPGILNWLARRGSATKAKTMQLLQSFAIAARSSAVADHYATKYLAKPQQWLTSALGPLISGFRKVEAEEQNGVGEHRSVRETALRKLRVAIFAANRSVWISTCEACLFLETGGSAVLSHPDVAVHGRKGLFMMHECKRILNKEVAGEGLWRADLTKCQGHTEGEVLEVQVLRDEDLSTEEEKSACDADHHDARERADAKDVDEDRGKVDAAETNNIDVVMLGATEHGCDGNDVVKAEQETENLDAADTHHEGGVSDATPMVGATEHAVDNESAMDQKKASAQIFQITISLRDDWLHRGDALQDMDLQTYAEFVERRPKPIRGADLQKAFAQPTFAFDAHYKLAPGHMQVLRLGGRRCLARFNVPNCLRENVNEGEENTQHKAFHCSLMRCTGVGMCADPLICAPTLLPNALGVFTFRPAWRAREKEILVLALRGHEKKLKARRFETLHDTSLCKVLQSTYDADVSCRMLQIDLQRWFRTGIRHLRENALAETPCNYGYPERAIHRILCLVGKSGVAEHPSGRPLWHDDQLHLAEWQALQQIESLFNLTLTVDAKNIAIEKLRAHKKGPSAHAEAADVSEPINKLQAADDDELHAMAGLAPLLDETLQKEERRGVALPVTDKEALIRLLTREDEVARARQPGQGRREALQCMREAADAYGTPQHLRTNATDPSAFGASEHEKTESLVRHRELLQKLRQSEDQAPSCETESGDSKQQSFPLLDARVELAPPENSDWLSMGPVDLAKYLCDKGTLAAEQRGPVALVARDMQRAYDEEVARRSQLTQAQLRAEGVGAAEHVTLPLKGRRLRLLLYGGGGCGKTRIINYALAKLFRRFYGEKGLVVTAFSNKAARLIGGKTSHTLTKIRGGQSLSMPRLRVQSDKERRALAAVWAPAGALVKDEFTQQPGALEHAVAVRATYGRERYHDLRCADYARPETNYASLPYVITAGDPLQFPPVPASSSLLAEPDGQMKEHRVAQSMFEDQDYVCELKTTMRFRGDPILTSILAKMRTPGEDRANLKLTEEEWRVLQSTDIAHGASLEGTELWYQSAFAWSYVCMAQWDRSLRSAAAFHETLFLCSAKDYIMNVDARDLTLVRDKLLQIPNMNTTGRLPAVLLLHLKMQVRITVSDERLAARAPVDTLGVVQNIELHPVDRARWQQQSLETIFALHFAPTVLVRIEDDETDTGLGPGIVAVEAVTCQPFTIDLEIDDQRCSRARLLKVRAAREQVPLTIAMASTLYTLQGTTTTPGLIYHFRTPRRISNVMKWIATYMALSRVQSLDRLRSIGLTPAIRELIDDGPPKGFLTRFLKVFGEKSSQTQRAVEAAMTELGWLDEDAGKSA